MTAEIVNKQNNRKFIPVLRTGQWSEAAPSWLVGKYYIHLSGDPYSERDYEHLVRTLLGIREVAPPVGKPMATVGSKTSAPSTPAPVVSVGGFEDIAITRVIVEDITAPRDDGTKGSALYAIPFALSRRPPSEWSDLLISSWDRPPQWTSMHRPGIARVSGSTVTLDGTTIEEVERHHRDTLQLAVQEANRIYRDWKDQQELARARQQAARDEHQARVEGVSKRIKFD